MEDKHALARLKALGESVENAQVSRVPTADLSRARIVRLIAEPGDLEILAVVSRLRYALRAWPDAAQSDRVRSR